MENASGAKLERPELFRLLRDAHPGDVLMVEQVDRLSRLARGDWDELKAAIRARGVRVVALDVQTSHMALEGKADGFLPRVLDAINDMLLEILAAVANKDYQDRRRRAAQGIAKAKAEGKYRGRPEDEKRNRHIMRMLREGMSWTAIIDLVSNEDTRLSRSTLAKLAKRVKVEASPKEAA